VIIFYVAIIMVWEGGHLVRPDLLPPPMSLSSLFGFGH
jgi:hypothetical protein